MDFTLQLIFIFVMLPILLQGSDPPQMIEHKINETAILGGNVTIFCNLTAPKNVVQITWQKVQNPWPQNIGTYSRRYGENILPPYKDRLECKTIEPNCSFITIHEVTFEDEACYKCLFNVFPGGSHGGQICLNIITLSVLEMKFLRNPDDDDARFIYSAVGKPAPQISIFPLQILKGPPQVSLNENPNGTVTITKIFFISLESVRVQNIQELVVHTDHPQRREEQVVLLSDTSETGDFYHPKNYYIIFVCFGIICVLILILACWIWKKKKSEKLPKDLMKPNAKDPEQLDGEALMTHSPSANSNVKS